MASDGLVSMFRESTTRAQKFQSYASQSHKFGAKKRNSPERI